MAGEYETEGIVIGAGTATVDGEDLQTQLPSADEKAALAGTGAPGAGDPYVSDSDARMTDTRDPNAHAASHESGGADRISLGIPSSESASGGFTSGGAGAWEDVDSITVPMPSAGNLFAQACIEAEAAAAAAVAPNFRLEIDGTPGTPVSLDLLNTQDAQMAFVSQLANLGSGTITVKLQVQDDGVTAVQINESILTGIAMRV